MASLPEDTILGHDLEIIDVYEYYDGPRLFSCRNRSGQLFLALSVEENHDESVWLYVAVSDERLRQIESGAMDLRTAFAAPEDRAAYWAYHNAEAESWRVEWKGAADLRDEVLPLAGEFLDVEHRLGTVLEPASRVAAQRQRETLRIALQVPGTPVHEAPSSLVGHTLTRLQELIAAIAQAVRGEATLRGRIPPDILTAADLRLVGTYAGSLGLDLASAQLADLFGGSVVADALAKLDALLDAGSDPEQLRSLLEEIRPRAASKYRSFIDALVEADASIDVDWGSVDQTRGGHHKLDARSLRAIAAVIDLVGDEFVETYNVTGPLVALNARTRYFELEDRDSGKRVSGRLDPDRFAEDQEFTINAVYVATIVESTEVSGVTGEEKVSRVLTELTPL